MKKIILLLVLLFMISCNSKKAFETNIKCDVRETENVLAFDSLYKNIDTTKLFLNKINEFEKVKTGVLFCQFRPNMKYGKFTIIKNIDNRFVCYNSGSSYNEEIILKNPDNKLLLDNLSSIDKKYYYEQCDDHTLHQTFYLMLVRVNGSIVSKYISVGRFKVDSVNGNTNLNIIKSILEIMERNSYKTSNH